MMEQNKLNKLKGFAILFPLVIFYTYINIDYIDEQLNLNVINMAIMGCTLILLWLTLWYVVRAAHKLPEEEVLPANSFTVLRMFITILSVYFFTLQCSLIKHHSAIYISDLAVALIVLALIVIIISIGFKLRLLNMVLYSAVITSLFVLNQFSFISYEVMGGLYVFVYIIAAVLFIKLSVQKPIEHIKESEL